MKPAFRFVAIAASALSVAAGCSNDGPTAQSRQPSDSTQPSTSTESTGSTDPTGLVESAGAPGQTVTVVAADNRFDPIRIEISPGTEVVWVNRGRNDHDLMTDFGFGVTANEFRPGDEYHHVFTEPGEFPYYCTIHGTADFGMIGTVVVTA